MFLVVVDWNPSGVSILKTYKFGSSALLQSPKWDLPRLTWLGLHAEELSGLPEECFQALSSHDRYCSHDFSLA